MFLYNLSIRLYSLLIWLVAPINRKARLLVRGRKNWQEPFRQKPLDHSGVPTERRPTAWFHAASLGEFEQGRPVMEAFRAAYPHWQLVVSFFSPSGFEVRKNYAGADVVTYLPADTRANAEAWYAQVRPELAFFIKYEFWYHYLHTLHQHDVPTVSFSAIFRPNQLFFKPYGHFYRNLLRYFRHIFVQNQPSVELLAGIGITAVSRAGDTRFDRVAQVAAAKRAIPQAADFMQNIPTLVIGSAWEADMAVLIPALNAFRHPLQVIIAPHEIHDAEIEGWQKQLMAPSVRFSELGTLPLTQLEARYLFIDNIGMLTSLYQYGTMAYIGGAFGKGLHNCLEAATFGLPLLFGPNHQKFQEAVDLVAQGGAFQVRSADDLTAQLTYLYENAPERERAGAVCQAYVGNNVGATAVVMQFVDQLIASSPPPTPTA